MKCNYCGYNLNIEDIYCPHCGKKNDHAAKHAADMEKFNKEFEETKEEVIANSKKFNNRTARIAIICVLVALIAVNIGLISNTYTLEHAIIQRKHAKEYKVHAAVLDKYEEDRAYEDICEYFTANRLSYTDQFDEYSKVSYAARAYTTIYKNVIRITNLETYTHFDPSELCTSIARTIEGYDKSTIRQSYEERERYDKMFAARHVEFTNGCRQDIQDMIQVYFGLTDEEANSIWTMKQARLGVLLEDSAEKMGYLDVYNTEESEAGGEE